MIENLDITKKTEYCLNCKNKPCMQGCPLKNNIPDFIQCMKEKQYEKAFTILSETTIFESICGRICPYESQCQGNCIRGIKGESVDIGELEAFLGDYALNNIPFTVEKAKENAPKVAIIGSGPAGLACAYYLSIRGIQVHIYEKHSQIGGLLRYGIPEFRLEKKILDKWLNKFILNKNVKIHTNVELEKDISLKELKEKFDKIVLAFGANISCKLHISGEDLENVLRGNELLEYQQFPDLKNKKIAIIGGGNVAIDVARTVKRLNANKVKIIYRRSEKQMPAAKKEIEEAKNEEIDFEFQTNIVKIMKNAIECVKTQLVKKEGEIREIPIDIEKSNFEEYVDYVILAIGSKPNKAILSKLDLEINEKGYIKINEKYQTSDENIYAIGDLVGTKQTVAWAAKTGFDCAKNL